MEDNTPFHFTHTETLLYQLISKATNCLGIFRFTSLSARPYKFALSKALEMSKLTTLTVLDRTVIENIKLCTSFSDYFVDKIATLKQTVARDKLSHPAYSVAHRPYSGSGFNFLNPVTLTEVLK